MRRELVHGSFNAQLFDMNMIYLTPVFRVKSINNMALSVLKQMGRNFSKIVVI